MTTGMPSTITDVYKKFYGAVDPEGANFWRNEFGSENLTPTQSAIMIRDIGRNDPNLNTGVTVEQAYKDYLGGNTDQAGINFWKSQFGSGPLTASQLSNLTTTQYGVAVPDSGGGGLFGNSGLGTLVGLIAAAYGIPAISEAISAGGLFSGAGALEAGAGAGALEAGAGAGAGALEAGAGALGAGAGAGALEAGAGAGDLLSSASSALTPAQAVAADNAYLASSALTPAQAQAAAIAAAERSTIAGLEGSKLGADIASGALGPAIPPGYTPPVTPSGVPPVAPPVSGVPPTGTIPPIVPPISPTDALTKAATTVGTGLLSSAATAGVKDLLNPNVIQGGLQTAGGLLQNQASKDAAVKAQQDILAATQQATTGAQFRPVGITTNFGSSQFQIDPKTGQLVSASYTAKPAITSAENQLMQLGSNYLAQTPEQVAQQYLSKQYELLDPSRQRQLAAIRNQNFQTGRGGLSVGSTGLRPSGAQGLMGTNPELEAYYNALAQQDAQLAASAQQAGQQQVTYGAGLFGQAGNLESLAQQPFTLGTGLGTSISTAGANAGRLGLLGAGSVAELGTSGAATTNPYATLLNSLGGPTSTLGKGLAQWLSTNTPEIANNIARGNDLMAGADYSF